MTNIEKTIQNLEKIYKELPVLAEEIPSIREEFDMENYGCYNYSTIGNTVCKSHGCGLGNAARLFDLSKDMYYDNKGGFDYRLFSKDILPSIGNCWLPASSLWYYLFSSDWGEDYSNYETFDYFIKRVGNTIQLLKERGVCAVGFDPKVSNNLKTL